jgi:hypothetical protein
MPSVSAQQFLESISKVEYLGNLTTRPKLSPIAVMEKQNLLHASVAILVASWDAHSKRYYKGILCNHL